MDIFSHTTEKAGPVQVTRLLICLSILAYSQPKNNTLVAEASRYLLRIYFKRTVSGNRSTA